MATSNNKRIEEMATAALKTALLGCPILESFINYNDRNYVVKVNGGEGRLLVKKKQVEEIFEKLEEIYNS